MHNFWYAMIQPERNLDAIFFETETGKEPVREWLLALSKSERKTVGSEILKVQYCWPIGKPLVESLGQGLWEVRVRLGDRIARVLFYIDGRKLVLLHAFFKKTQKTPKHELDLAMKRKKQWRSP